jgi:ABC-type Zn uptake system ZnuABC Zn-binding protein ZnuA
MMLWIRQQIARGGIATGFAATLLALGCGTARDPWAGQPGPPRVVVTFPPLYCFALNVAEHDAGLLTLATSRGPHLYEPTVEDALKLRQADLFFINGLQLDDHFAERMARSSHNRRFSGPDPPGLVKIGDRLLAHKGMVDRIEEHEKHSEPGEHDHDEHTAVTDADHHHGEYDPHVWLGLPQVEHMVEVIRDELVQVDPLHAPAYAQRAQEYITRLKKLHAAGKASLAGKKERSLVTFHESLHYFAKSFDLTIAGVIQARPGIEADPATFDTLLRTCKDKGVRLIATEPQFRQKGAAQTLLSELRRRGLPDAEIIEIDTLETVSDGDVLDRDWYVKKMQANLDTLIRALR